MLVVVDDFQWVDRSTADVLLGIAGALAADRIALVIAVRDSERSPGLEGLQQIDLPPLSKSEATELLRPFSLSPAKRGEALTWAAGSPLRLLEFASAKTANQDLRVGAAAGRTPGPPLIDLCRVAALEDDAAIVRALVPKR